MHVLDTCMSCKHNKNHKDNFRMKMLPFRIQYLEDNFENDNR